MRESNPRQRLDRAPCFRYTNEAVVITSDQLTGRARESNPGRDIHSVECCHYTKLAVDIRFTAEEEGLEPSPPMGRPRLADACDKPVFASLPLAEARIEKRVASSEKGNGTSSDFSLLDSDFSHPMPPPGIEPGFRASHARVVFRSTTGTLVIALARIRTRTAAFEAPHDLHFTTRACLLRLATRLRLLASPHTSPAGLEPAPRS